MEAVQRMKTQKQDRRSRRSRQLIEEAFVSLLQERPYVDLTVQDILDRANIGRSTFYAHYWDKDDLLSSQAKLIIDTLSQHLDAERKNAGGTARLPLIPVGPLFRHIQEQHQLYHALTRGPGLDLVIRTLRVHLCERVERQLRAAASRPLPEITITVTAQAVVGTFLALLQWRLETEMALSAEEMDDYFYQLVLPGVQAMLAGNERCNDCETPGL